MASCFSYRIASSRIFFATADILLQIFLQPSLVLLVAQFVKISRRELSIRIFYRASSSRNQDSRLLNLCCNKRKKAGKKLFLSAYKKSYCTGSNSQIVRLFQTKVRNTIFSHFFLFHREFTCWLQSMSNGPCGGLFDSNMAAASASSKRSSSDRMASGPPQVTISGVSGHIVQYNALSSPIGER